MSQRERAGTLEAGAHEIVAVRNQLAELGVHCSTRLLQHPLTPLLLRLWFT